MADQRKPVKTATPGVYRRGKTYLVRYRVNGQPRVRYARTCDEARDLKASITTDLKRGEYRERGTASFEDYAREWLDTYQGRTTRGFRESTRVGYRRTIERKAIPFFGRRVRRLSEIERHTCASMLFAEGRNPKQVQTWLGHSDPGFTLRAYVHLIDDGLGDADFLDGAAWARGYTVGTHEPREPSQTAIPLEPEKPPVSGANADPMLSQVSAGS